MPVEVDHTSTGIPPELAWAGIGYSTKGNAKAKLVTDFVEGLDYELMNIHKLRPQGGTSEAHQINLTVDCFKQFCMMAGKLNDTPGTPTGANQHTDQRSNPDYNRDCLGSRGSTDPEYLAARIARDHPDIQARISQGEFKSVRAAAVAAGIVKPRKQFTVGHSTDPRDFAVKLSDELEHDFLVQLVAAW